MAQGLFIHWDTELYSKEKHCLCNAKTFSINEELGKVKIILDLENINYFILFINYF